MPTTRLLAEAISRQDLAGVRAALAAGADPNARLEGVSMLGMLRGAAARLVEMHREPWLGILGALLEAGADPNAPTDGSLHPDYFLHDAAQCAAVPAIRLLLEHGANPDLLVDGTESALDWAVDDAFFFRLELPAEYADAPLPRYPLPSDAEFDAQGLAFKRWMLSCHQQGIALLRDAGARRGADLAAAPPAAHPSSGHA